MVFIDVIGLLISLGLVGIRYPHWGILASFINILGLLLSGVVFHEQINYVVAAGAFSIGVFNQEHSLLLAYFLQFSGIWANFLVMHLAGGVRIEKTMVFMDPTCELKAPIAVINMRMAVLAILFNFWNFHYGGNL